MLINAAHSVTNISDIEEINSHNFFEATSYIDNLYNMINILQNIWESTDYDFLPTFKGKFTSKKYEIESNKKENEMKCFTIRLHNDISVDEENKVYNILGQICESIYFGQGAHDREITFILD